MLNNLKNLNHSERRRLSAVSNMIIKGAYTHDNLTQAKLTYFKDMDDWIVKTPYFSYRIEKFTHLLCQDFCYMVTKFHNTNKKYSPVIRLVDPVTFDRIYAMGFETLIVNII